MQIATAVIGAWYGDEGKGLITDYVCSADPDDTAVVRYNGGAQAGHTVCTPEGKRHVFSHFGSGSFLGCPTYLSKFFVSNPRLFMKEWRELEDIGVTPKVFIHPRSPVSTPWDVMINRMSEAQVKHGSCGAGVSETMIRTAAGYGLYAEDFRSPLTVSNKLWAIKNEYMRGRMQELGVEGTWGMYFKHSDDKTTEEYMSDVRRFRSRFQLESEAPKQRHVVFEGAQGLCLDECRIDQFPHTTHSRTGLPNVVHLCKEWGISDLSAIYVSRTYVTRHGAGPLEGETDKEEKWGCETNSLNRWQGAFRYAPLNINKLRRNIRLDLAQAGVRVAATLAFTHCDQEPYPGSCSIRYLPWKYFSYGPTRKDVDTSK